jgi:hypothetical protein
MCLFVAPDGISHGRAGGRGTAEWQGSRCHAEATEPLRMLARPATQIIADRRISGRRMHGGSSPDVCMRSHGSGGRIAAGAALSARRLRLASGCGGAPTLRPAGRILARKSATTDTNTVTTMTVASTMVGIKRLETPRQSYWPIRRIRSSATPGATRGVPAGAAAGCRRWCSPSW